MEKTYYYKTSSMSRVGFRHESAYWRETVAHSKAEIRNRFKSSTTRVEKIITQEEMDEIISKNPETKVLLLDY